jgi:hypothetical protein
MSGQRAIEREKLRQKFDRFGSGIRRRRRRRRLAIFKLDTEPFRGGTLPALLAILSGQVNYRNSSTSGEEVGQE